MSAWHVRSMNGPFITHDKAGYRLGISDGSEHSTNLNGGRHSPSLQDPGETACPGAPGRTGWWVLGLERCQAREQVQHCPRPAATGVACGGSCTELGQLVNVQHSALSKPAATGALRLSHPDSAGSPLPGPRARRGHVGRKKPSAWTGRAAAS